MQVTLRNDFHSTRTTIHIPDGHDPVEWQTSITEDERDRVKRDLCGLSDCRCEGMIRIESP